MVLQYVWLTPDELVNLQRLLKEDPGSAFDFATELSDGNRYGENDAPRSVDVDKAWAGLDLLLAKARTSVNFISGGTPVTKDTWGYDSPRLLTAAEVAKAARFVADVPSSRLLEHYDSLEFTRRSVYPDIWNEEWAVEYLADAYARLGKFLTTAERHGASVLLWLT